MRKQSNKVILAFVIFGIVQFLIILGLDDYWHTWHGSLTRAMGKAFLITMLVELYGLGMYKILKK